MTGEHIRVGIFWWESRKGEKDRIEKLRLEHSEDALHREQKQLRWGHFEYKGDELGGREEKET